ncbi:MAG: glycosyltransferase N-terminal domain-containing protein [Phycisphaerales bacterium]|nr:glycosyltransferase N-terminal domain-containing protein [Phycisphaerales bacterium]
MRWLTDVIYLIVLILTAPVWFTKMAIRGKLRTDWAGRLGCGARVHASDGRRRILIHAVSVGEVNAVRSLVSRLESRADLELVIASTTDTGFTRAESLYGDRHHVVRYPLDLSWCVRRFLRRIHPAVACLVELEVWPNFMSQCDRIDCPVMVINGRLSQRSFRRYRLIRLLLRSSFRRVRQALVQNDVYAERFKSMGVLAGSVSVVGSLKWDNTTPDHHSSEVLAKELGIDADRLLIVAGSTSPGEHELLHAAVPPDVQLLCAPRRPEWFDGAATVLDGCTRRSTGHTGGNPDRYLLDTIGELSQAYALADIVVIGRSFGTLHGSDVSEPAGLGKPVVVGPAVDDFRDIVDILLSKEAMIQCNRQELAGVLHELIDSSQLRSDLSHRSMEVMKGLGGASLATEEAICSMVDDSSVEKK